MSSDTADADLPIWRRKASHQAADLRQPDRVRTHAFTGSDAPLELLCMTARERCGHTEFVCDVAPVAPGRVASSHGARPLGVRTCTSSRLIAMRSLGRMSPISFRSAPLLHGAPRPLGLPTRTHITRVASTRARPRSCYRPRPRTRFQTGQHLKTLGRPPDTRRTSGLRTSITDARQCTRAKAENNRIVEGIFEHVNPLKTTTYVAL